MKKETAVNKLSEEIAQTREAFSHAGAIEEVVNTFDGKVFNKRLETALRSKVHDDIRVKTEYNSFIITIYFNGVHTGYNTITLVHQAIKNAYGDDTLTDDNRIIAKTIIDGLKEMKDSSLKYNKEMEEDLSKIDDILLQYNKLVNECQKFNDSVNYTLRQTLELRSFDNLREYF